MTFSPETVRAPVVALAPLVLDAPMIISVAPSANAANSPARKSSPPVPVPRLIAVEACAPRITIVPVAAI